MQKKWKGEISMEIKEIEIKLENGKTIKANKQKLQILNKSGEIEIEVKNSEKELESLEKLHNELEKTLKKLKKQYNILKENDKRIRKNVKRFLKEIEKLERKYNVSIILDFPIQVKFKTFNLIFSRNDLSNYDLQYLENKIKDTENNIKKITLIKKIVSLFKEK